MVQTCQRIRTNQPEHSLLAYRMYGCMSGSRRETGGLDPPEKSQKYRVSKQYWSGTPENPKSFKPAFNVGPSSALRVNDGPFIVVFRYSILSKNVVKIGPTEKLSGSAHGM